MGEHGWQLTSSSSDAYEAYLVPTIFEPWAKLLVERVDPRPGERLLDVACGTGVVARIAAPRVRPAGTVTGVDVNPGMLATARRAAGEDQADEADEADGAIEWREADALDLPFPDASFDAVVCQQALQFVSDRAAMVREMRRVLAAGGRVALSVWRGLEHNQGFARLAQVLDHRSARAGEIMRSPFTFDDQDEIRQLFTGAGFEDVRVLIEALVCRFPSPAELLRYEALSSPLAEPLGQLDTVDRAGLTAEVDDALAPYVDDDGLAIVMESHVVIAT
jgi:ubiquinone/menaquinone biosynthesis C-methylase UbiE